jgi:hypothetical protein
MFVIAGTYTMKTAAAFTLLLIAGASAGEAHTAHFMLCCSQWLVIACMSRAAFHNAWAYFSIAYMHILKSTNKTASALSYRCFSPTPTPEPAACCCCCIAVLILQPATADKIGAGNMEEVAYGQDVTC